MNMKDLEPENHAAASPKPGTRLVGASLVWLSCFTATPAIAEDPIQWSITPYIWASDTKVDLSFRENAIGGDQVSFKELLDTLDSSFMLHVEGGRGRWSAFGDFTYLEISDSEQRPLVRVDSSSEQMFLDAAVGFWPTGVGQGLNLYGGLRYASFDDRYRFSASDEPLRERRNNVDYTDVLLGIRYLMPFAERWQLMTRADASFGDTEGTWLVRAQLGYAVGKRRMNQFLFGYEYKAAEYRNGDFTADYSFKGPTVGFNFRF
jgi:hypothetical protein